MYHIAALFFCIFFAEVILFPVLIDSPDSLEIPE